MSRYPAQKYSGGNHVIFTITSPIRILSEANLREHWAPKAKRAKIQRATVGMLVQQLQKLRHHPGTFDVLLIRVAPRELDDDNLARGFKGCRDGVADAIGVDDGSKRFTWRYAQRKGAPKKYSVIIQIETKEGL